MKATIGEVVLNMDYFRSMSADFAYFYVPADEVTSEVFNAVGDYVSGIRKYDDATYQIQIDAKRIKWEDD